MATMTDTLPQPLAARLRVQGVPVAAVQMLQLSLPGVPQGSVHIPSHWLQVRPERQSAVSPQLAPWSPVPGLATQSRLALQVWLAPQLALLRQPSAQRPVLVLQNSLAAQALSVKQVVPVLVGARLRHVPCCRSMRLPRPRFSTVASRWSGCCRGRIPGSLRWSAPARSTTSMRPASMPGGCRASANGFPGGSSS